MARDWHRLDADGDLSFDVAGGKLRLTLAWDGNRGSSTLELPYPRAGYGGHELVVARDERCAALFLYSGQSEVGFEVFEIGRRLHHLFSLPYERGLSDPPKFSDDGAWLVMLVRTSGGYTWQQQSNGWALAWAELYALHVPTLTLAKTEITLEADEPADEHTMERDFATYGRLGFWDDEELEVEIPGDGDPVQIELPPKDVRARYEP